MKRLKRLWLIAVVGLLLCAGGLPAQETPATTAEPAATADTSGETQPTRQRPMDLLRSEIFALRGQAEYLVDSARRDLEPSEEVTAFIAEADQVIRELGFKDPARMSDVCAPGVWEGGGADV